MALMFLLILIMYILTLIMIGHLITKVNILSQTRHKVIMLYILLTQKIVNQQ